jgi:hypothetical protein
MLKIKIDMLKHEGQRIARLENYTEEQLDDEITKAQQQDKDHTHKEDIPRNIETNEERILVTKTNWLGRRERDIPKRSRPIAPGGNTKRLDSDKEEKKDEDDDRFVVTKKNQPKENKPKQGSDQSKNA